MPDTAAQHTFSLEISAELDDRLQRLSQSRRSTPHGLMREAIAQYVGREELRADALAAWADYEMTGAHAPAAAADIWLARLEAGEEAAAPECQP